MMIPGTFCVVIYKEFGGKYPIGYAVFGAKDPIAACLHMLALMNIPFSSCCMFLYIDLVVAFSTNSPDQIFKI